jgi:ABC-2 type transport system ATP-binding protein
MKKTIIIENLYKTFKNFDILKNINISFEAAKIHGLIGRNGSGKTMLLKCICGFVKPTSGKITINDKIIGKDINIPDNMGIIIEAPGFLPNYSGLNNLKFLAMIKNKITIDKIKDSMKLVGLEPENKKWVGKYSLGMRQRLGIAQALMENPDILILDEPMNGLDNSGIKDVRSLLFSLKNKNKTIIIASHSKEDISILCDTVHEMDDGKIIS